ncbi:leucine carboxyl methyltransferase [Thraustotheca clavata]|uniref:Leucine carboxyl methyltransferase 1 n=1 Tax=Thraustotheca clavata TaxID=74557 RepID=A0A1W0A1B7_9STRA|nr:leucine carboxyl methyltransferase [Thraustotheca clavata]
MNDASVQATASDAASCKLSASRLGYWIDPFASMFSSFHRKMPLINRGYYARVRSIELLLHRFLGTNSNAKQVIVLGAGQDTMFFRLKTMHPELLKDTLYVEMDFPMITKSKVRLCRRHKAVAECIGEVETNEIEMKAQGYALAAADLRELSTVQEKLTWAGIDPTIPTLVLSECVLCYMEPEYSQPLIDWFGSAFTDCAIIVYEQIRPHDAFGQTMVENISLRGCDLKSIHAYPEPEDQHKRFAASGFGHVECWDMNRVYYEYLPLDERRQKEHLELFDELEEYHMLQGHYCLVVAVKNATSLYMSALELYQSKDD